MAPLLFLFASDLFDHMISLTLRTGKLKGLELEEHNMTLCQDFYADNTTFCVVAEQANVNFCMQLADQFGSLSGLFCQWSGMSAVYIGSDVIPDKFADVNWEMENSRHIFQAFGNALWGRHRL
jgi:hypothetical protein